ncbi:MAG: hypothetical protein ACKVPX_02145 [Myxococcaceae bacterium]
MASKLAAREITVGASGHGQRVPLSAAPLARAHRSRGGFPVSHALSELPLYFGHVGPTLRERGWPAWATVALPALVLSMQHLVMPLALDARYLVWRGLMFLPFALAVGIVLHHRPTVRPWLLVMHGFMDAQLPVLTWLTSTGALTFQT